MSKCIEASPLLKLTGTIRTPWSFGHPKVVKLTIQSKIFESNVIAWWWYDKVATVRQDAAVGCWFGRLGLGAATVLDWLG